MAEQIHPRCNMEFYKQFDAYEAIATAYLESEGKGKDAKGYGTIITGIEYVEGSGITFSTSETWPMGGHEDSSIELSWDILNPIPPDGLGRTFK